MKGIIFDMDGTMVDNMMVHHRAWQKKLADLGLEMTLDDVMEKIHGINEEIIANLFGDRYTPEERRQIAWEKEEAYRDIYKPELRLIDGLESFLGEVRKRQIPMGVGSAAPPENVDFVLDNLGIRSWFGSVKHSKDVKRGKPDPEIYHAVAAELGLQVQDCLIFEDSPVGAEAAARAGSPLVVVLTTHKQEEFSHLTNVIRFIKDFTMLTLEDLPAQSTI
ncbi:MAG: HAD family phosphatase [Bacteroidota bacterium]